MSPRDAAAQVLRALLPELPLAALSGASPWSTDPKPRPPAARARGRGRAPTSAVGAALPADQALREFFRRHPGLGKRDRLQVANWVFDVLRNLRLYQELAQRRRQAAAGAADSAVQLIDIARAMDGELPAEAPGEPPAGAERRPGIGKERSSLGAAMSRPADLDSLAAGLPPAVRYSLPEWLWEALQATHGPRAGDIAAALLHASPVDVRVNLLVGKAVALQALLGQRGIEAVPVADVPTALRISGRPDLEHLDLFRQGWFEIQDAGSQRIADACGARRGALVVDFCAGAGGKTLALAARMRNLGKVLAFDTSDERLSRLLPRARRAGVSIVEPLRIDGIEDPRLGRYRRRSDVVLVDAPCSGTGTLRRSPDLKWRLSPAQVQAYGRQQAGILAAASALVKPGGTLVYATCSLLAEENEHQVERFGRTAHASGFELAGTDSWLADHGPSSSFFLAKWVLKAPG